MPAWIVVVFGNLLKSKSKIVVWAYPFNSINGACLHGSVKLTSRNVHWNAPSSLKDFASKTWKAHFESLDIIKRIDFFIKPTKHLGTSVAPWQGFHVERFV